MGGWDGCAVWASFEGGLDADKPLLRVLVGDGGVMQPQSGSPQAYIGKTNLSDA